MAVKKHIVAISNRHDSVRNINCMIPTDFDFLIYKKGAKQLASNITRAALNVLAFGKFFDSKIKFTFVIIIFSK